MIKIYQTAEGLCVKEQDLGKLFDVAGYSLFSYIFCGYHHNNLPKDLADKYRETSYWDIKVVKNSLEEKLRTPASIAKLSPYRYARMEYLIDYLNRFIKKEEIKQLEPICING